VLGELNWIFTAITDTIAWNLLPPDLFQRLFRQVRGAYKTVRGIYKTVRCTYKTVMGISKTVRTRIRQSEAYMRQS